MTRPSHPFTLALATLCAMTAFANFDIELDMKAQPIRDVRTSTCGPIIGYAGSVQSIASSVGGDTFWAVTNRMEMSRGCREAGAWLQRVWSAEEWFARERLQVLEGQRHQGSLHA